MTIICWHGCNNVTCKNKKISMYKQKILYPPFPSLFLYTQSVSFSYLLQFSLPLGFQTIYNCP